MMRINAYVCAGPLKFGKSTKDDCVGAFGIPICRKISRDDEEEYHYKDFIVRFDSTGELFRECTLLPMKEATIASSKENIQVTWDLDFLRTICKVDGKPIVVYGFLILKALGIAVTGLHDGDKSQLAITAFSLGDFDEFMSNAEDFDFNSLT